MTGIIDLMERRRKNNERVLKRSANPNDNLETIDRQATWWPPRPIIKKDPEEIARVYGDKTSEDRNKDTE